jgi:putative oxidoreductase
MRLLEWASASTAPRSAVLIRLLVGAVFLSEGIQKFLFSDSLGTGRFAKIGIPDPGFTAPFVGGVEVVFGLFLIVGLLTRLSVLPLLAVICVAITTTKIPMLHEKGFWAMAHEARTDYSMLLGLLFLAVAGGGPVSVDCVMRARIGASRK